MNRNPNGGVLLLNGRMHAPADILPGSATQINVRDLDEEFAERLADAGTLATRVAYAVLRNREDAEDVAQEALIKAYQHFRSLRDVKRFRSWLVRISWRLALDHRRATKRRELRELTAVTSPATPDIEAVAVHNEFRQRLLAAVDALPDKLRIVVALSAIEGYDTKEVAALLGVPEGTVKSRLHAARKRIVERLQ